MPITHLLLHIYKILYNLSQNFNINSLHFHWSSKAAQGNEVYLHNQGVIQDFEVEGGNEKSNQKMLLKKGQLLFQYPAMDTQS